MNIYQSISQVMAEVEAIKKDKDNRQQGFKFRGIDDVYNAVHPILAKHGVFSVPYVEEERTEERTTKNGGNLIYRILTIKYRFYASDGTFVDARVIGEGMDSGDKAANKAMAIGHKYALLQVLCIPTEDMVDPDSESPEASSPRYVQATVTAENPPTVKIGKAPEPPKVERQEEPQNPRMYEIIPEHAFEPKVAFAQLLEMADGDKDMVGEMLKGFGAFSIKEITYEAYKASLQYLKIKKGVAIAS